jgi:haloacid dehalogenase superfamily, subfamily IA, variant 1 with third motif having Dx(3-4)D or Dx(3-4)E
MTIRNIVFDFDGTLANTLPIIVNALQRVFKEHDGFDLGYDDFIRLAGPSELGIIELNLKNRERLEAATEQFLSHYNEKHHEFVEPVEEIALLLKDLAEAGVRMALFTGKARRTLDISLAKLRMNLAFDQIVTGDDVKESKPSPEGLHAILGSLGWNREDTIFIGDSNDDMEAGAAAGVRTYAAQWMPAVQSKEYATPPLLTFYSVEEFRAFLAGEVAGFNN